MVLRHAKAVAAEDAVDDHSRALTERGRADAKRVAARVVELGWVPDRALVSDAARTEQTWERFARRLPAEVEAQITRGLYHADPVAIGALVGEQPDQVQTLIVVGHNPGLEEFVRRLTGQVVPLATATAALLTHGADGWAAAAAARDWRIVEVLRAG